jgi:hypothetical protein
MRKMCVEIATVMGYDEEYCGCKPRKPPIILAHPSQRRRANAELVIESGQSSACAMSGFISYQTIVNKGARQHS